MKTLQVEVAKLIEQREYELAANTALGEMGVKLSVTFLKYGKHFISDKELRDIYTCTLTRGTRSFTFEFGQSLHCSGEYIGHKHMCMNSYGKCLFTKKEVEKMTSFGKREMEIKRNPNFEVPTSYDVISCLQKYDVGSFEDFCSEFGYDVDSISANKVYKAVVNEYDNMAKLFSDEELQILGEIS
jgi:hypothetical protein